MGGSLGKGLQAWPASQDKSLGPPPSSATQLTQQVLGKVLGPQQALASLSVELRS